MRYAVSELVDPELGDRVLLSLEYDQNTRYQLHESPSNVHRHNTANAPQIILLGAHGTTELL